MTIDAGAARTQIEQTFADSIVPTLVEYIGIPNKSPMFDPKWREHGHMQRAVDLLAGWAKAHLPPGATLEVVQVEDRTPVIFIEVPGTARDGDTVLMYGHLDKQPEMTGWDDGLGPWLPVMRGERLYGRGGADDGYAIFASLTALNVLAEQGRPYARCCVLIEACEESGSFDLPAYIEHLAPRIGTPSLVVCLDSGCGNYDQLWCTTSLRGLVLGTLEVSLLREGVHSGDGSGVVASSFRVVRALLDRLEDAGSGAIKLEELYATIPRGRIEQASRAADVLGDEVWSKFPLQPGVRPVHADAAELILNRTWRPALSVTGAEGLPPIGNAGNVLRPTTAIKLSLRVPPTVDAAAALARVKELLEANPPYGAKVTFTPGGANAGWNAPALAPWLEAALEAASATHFGKPPVSMGEGGSIPFMGMLGQRFPEAQFFITGVLGPGSNAHGPNEFLDLPMAKKLTACVADVIARHATR
ncbi:MAG: M20 family metallopeptidase [Kofleriaceae bacterium]|jgi:acetylornithine deacetylase/succinyl-diaminopimelate desuccinylase-like protein|nr:M20 family metallopeptidase [Kofleriaceae bacterium]MBP9168318.1 M20 family metallopeptidase [Kofleriaceae bacterium]MBP9857197.1 M20 family metallopeptidase [Kofleriaceae bacterium]